MLLHIGFLLLLLFDPEHGATYFSGTSVDFAGIHIYVSNKTGIFRPTLAGSFCCVTFGVANITHTNIDKIR
jgi:hypothetical protein